MAIFSGIVIMLCAPVQDPNRPFTPGEHKAFGRFARIIFMVETAILVAFLVLNLTRVAHVISLSHFVQAIMLIAGMRKNRAYEIHIRLGD